MTAATKTIAEINGRLRRGEAVVMTAMEFKDEVRRGRRFTPVDVDVVTTATRAIMSGTTATVVLPIAEDGEFQKLKELWLNGVPCATGLHPVEKSRYVDAIIPGTGESRDHHGRYGGGHLLRDLVEGKVIEVEAVADDGRQFYSRVTLDDMPFARLYSFRNAYQNYAAFTNFKNERSYLGFPASIFSSRPMPRLKSITTSGSGEINPAENDPDARVLRSGMKIMVNGVLGTLIGWGTRSHDGSRNLSLAADLRGMDPQFMGGAKTSHGVEVTNGIAIPFPILDQKIVDNLSECLDANIPLNIADISDRVTIAKATYADVWRDTALEVEFRPDHCIVCSFQCAAEYYCPMGAISWRDKTINQSLCIACGACTANCPGGAFAGKDRDPEGCIGTIPAFETTLPISFRMSNRWRAQLLAKRLKLMIAAGDFLLTESDLTPDMKQVEGL
jgi:putative methanogenesis marker 16 metalloprotein